MLKKLTSLLLAVIMLFSLVACGKTEDKKEKGDKNSNGAIDTADGYILKSSSYDNQPIELGKPDKALDPEEVYAKLDYTPQMFYGDYSIFGGDDAEKKYAAETDYMQYEGYDYGGNPAEVSITELPYRIQAGKHSLSHMISYVEEYDWMRVYFYREVDGSDPVLTYYQCAYTIDGNKLSLKPINNFNYDKATEKITYSFLDVEWEYEFDFCGRELTLSNGKNSITMQSGLSAYRDELYIKAEGYLSPNSKRADNIDFIDLRYQSEDETYLYFGLTSEESYYNFIASLSESGLFTFAIPSEDGVKTYQYVYFLCGNDGIVLTDGENAYYYNDSYSDRNQNDINKYLSEDQTGKLEDLSESELEAIVEKKESLMDDLAKAFSDEGIKVTVDRVNGELAMDTSVLFGGDSAVLTADGKKFLNKFVKAYTSIVFSDEYRDFVSKTMVEGHTAPLSTSTYESGLPLSEERADNVKAYCISAETGVDTAELAASLEAVGYSNSKPIYKDNGDVDMTASRRVSFRFIINLGN